MLKNFLLVTLLSNGVYLGYQKQFSNCAMFTYLLGSRKNIDIHNLNISLFQFQKTLTLLRSSWFRFTPIWVVAPLNKLIKKYYTLSSIYYTLTLLYIWIEKWSFNIFSNTVDNTKLETLRTFVFPAILFYLNFTDNKAKFNSVFRSGILQVGLADSNSSFNSYNYLVNANEKSAISYLFFLNTIFLEAVSILSVQKKTFLL